MSYLNDQFTDTNGVSLDAHTMNTGSGWTEALGNWDIQSNRANLASSAGDGQNVAHADAGQANCTVKADLISSGSGDCDAGLLFNFVDTSNYWIFVATVGTGYILYERNAGTFTARKTITATIASSTTYALAVTTAGDYVYLHVNGTMVGHYNVSSRPHKTATKHGIRRYSADTGSRFDNFDVVVSESLVFPPDLLSYTKVGTAQSLISAFTNTVHSDTFATNTIANYTTVTLSGSNTITLGSGDAVFNGAATGGALLKPTISPGVAPYMYAKIVVSATSADNDVVPVVGFHKDSSNYVWAYVYQGDLGIDSKNNGTQVQDSVTAAYSPPYTVYLVFCWPEAWAWIDTGSGPTPILKITLNSGVDLRLLTKFSTDWLPVYGFDRLASSASGTASDFASGYVGGAPGTRDYKPVTYADGKPYISGSLQYFSATCATGDSFDTNHMCIISVDIDTGTAAIVSHLFYNICTTDIDNPAGTKDACTALYGGQIVRTVADDGWIIFTNGWGYQNESTGVGIFYAETSANILTGVHDLDAYQLAIPTSYSVYDCSWRWESAEWKMVCAETNAATGWTNYYTTYFTGSDPDSMSRIRTDTGYNAEQQIWMKVGDIWYANSGGGSGPHFWNADITTYRGSPGQGLDLSGTNVTYSTYGSGFCLTAINRSGQTQYMVLLFSNDQSLSGTATKGYLWVEQSNELRDGNEWSYGGGAVVKPRSLLTLGCGC